MPATPAFPPPGIAEETNACFIVRDANGQAFAQLVAQFIRRRSACACIVCGRSKVMLFARQRGQSSNDHGAYRALL
jgi:hypothetical protein